MASYEELINCTTVCNMCGKPFQLWDAQEDFSIHKHPLGYGTKYDTEDLELHLCCECMEKIIDMCKINPVIFWDEEDWKEEE